MNMKPSIALDGFDLTRAQLKRVQQLIKPNNREVGEAVKHKHKELLDERWPQIHALPFRPSTIRRGRRPGTYGEDTGAVKRATYRDIAYRNGAAQVGYNLPKYALFLSRRIEGDHGIAGGLLPLPEDYQEAVTEAVAELIEEAING